MALKKLGTAKASAKKTLTLNLPIPSSKTLAVLGLLIGLAVLIVAIGLFPGSDNATARVVSVNEEEPGYACEAAGGEVVLQQDCSVSNVISGDFKLKKTYVCCKLGMH